MDPNEASAALANAGRIEQKLAERARWPIYRHALFGLAEGLIVAGLAQPLATSLGMTAGALGLIAICVMDDRRRHGMFISGWQEGATRPLTLLIALFVVAMAVAAVYIGDGETAQPLGYLIGAVTFAVCTALSLRWEKVFRAQLGGGEAS